MFQVISNKDLGEGSDRAHQDDEENDGEISSSYLYWGKGVGYDREVDKKVNQGADKKVRTGERKGQRGGA